MALNLGLLCSPAQRREKKGEEGEKEASFCDSEKPQGLQEETHVASLFLKCSSYLHRSVLNFKMSNLYQGIPFHSLHKHGD